MCSNSAVREEYWASVATPHPAVRAPKFNNETARQRGGVKLGLSLPRCLVVILSLRPLRIPRAPCVKTQLRNALLALALTLGTPATADDSDLDRIPQNLPPPSAETSAPPDPNTLLYLEDAIELDANRSHLVVPLPPPSPPTWAERLFFDARVRRALADNLDLVVSDRFTLRAEDHLKFPSHEDVRNDLREAYLAWTIDPETFLDIGRINLKSGVALGFNPTDFFRTRAVVEPLTADPSVLREDRLGTLMVEAQRVWTGGSLTLAFAPKVTGRSKIYSNTDLPVFNPVLDRTNWVNRGLVKLSLNLGADWNPEVLAYFEDGRVKWGANLTYGIGQSAVTYLEWAGGDRASLVSDALAYGRATATIPIDSPPPLAGGGGAQPLRSFNNDLSLGASYTTESKIVINLEYHFHQAGFSGDDWHDWVTRGALGIPPLDAELWYIRGYASDQQEPTAKHSLFLRADRQDAFIPNLELTGFLNVDARDGSMLGQLSAGYDLSREWTLGAQATATLGGKRTDFGSVPGAASLFLFARRDF